MCILIWEMGLVLSRVRNVIMIGKEEEEEQGGMPCKRKGAIYKKERRLDRRDIFDSTMHVYRLQNFKEASGNVFLIKFSLCKVV